MKPIRIVTILLAASLLFSGCDFFRSILGKPTSKEIEAARIEQEAAGGCQKGLHSQGRRAARLAAEAAAHPVYSNYYVIMGCYKVPANAQRLKAKLEAKGYDVTELGVQEWI